MMYQAEVEDAAQILRLDDPDATWYCPSGPPWVILQAEVAQALVAPEHEVVEKSIPPARQTQKTPDVCIPLAGDERGSRSEGARARRRPRRARGALAPRLGAHALEPLESERARDRGRARGRDGGRRLSRRGQSNSRVGVPVSSGGALLGGNERRATPRRARPSDHRRARLGPRAQSTLPIGRARDSPRSAEREPLDARRRRGVRGPRRTPRGVFLSAGTANHPAFLLVLQTRVWAR